MYTEPTIVNAEGPGRPYVTFYLNGIRQRISTGRVIGLRIFPLKAKTPEERLKSLQALREAIKDALAAGTYNNIATLTKNADVRLILTEVDKLTKEVKKANEHNEQRLMKLEQIQKLLADYLS